MPVKIKASSAIMSREDIQQVLDSPIPYNNETEEENTKKLFATLSVEEVELAAQSSYAYWLATVVSDYETPTNQERDKMATREARRYICGNPFDVAEKELKETCEFRKDRRLDLIRACFTEGAEYDSEDDKQLADKLRAQITNDVKKQSAFVRGLDKDGLALYSLYARTDKNTVTEEFVVTQIYGMERAIASTEFSSRGKLEKISVVLDFGTFKSATAPTMEAVKQVANVLQHCYSERLKRLIIIDPPFWMRTLYAMIKPFLDPVTKQKFVVASGAKAKLKIVSEVIDEDNAMTFQLPNGKLTDEVDLDRYTQQVPFHCGYPPPSEQAK